MGSACGFAIDVGTTGLCAMLYDLKSGRLLGAKSAPNPQSRFGADVLSRVKAATDGFAVQLKTTLQHALFDLCAELLTAQRLAPGDVDAAVLTGNTVMLYLLTGADPAELSAAPFTCSHRFGEEIGASFLPMRRGAKVYLPPCISAFLGADAVCAALGSRLTEKGTRLLADLGTNGEILLHSGDAFYGVSCAAGPAFEGVGLACGMPAVSGAICEVTLSGGHFLLKTTDGTAPKGLCGSGILDLLACMLRRGDLTGDGLLRGGTVFYIEDTPVYLTQADIRSFQPAKAAVRAGLEFLLHTAGVCSADSLELAGSFGTALRASSAARVGLIPPSLAEATRGVGNAAAKGAAMLLTNRGLCRKAEEIAAQTKTISLAAQEDWGEQLCRYMTFG